MSSLLIQNLFSFFKENYPVIYEKIIVFLDTTSPYVPIFLVSWFLILTLFYLIELFVFFILCSKNDKIQSPNWMPKFIHKYLNNLYEESQTSIKLLFVKSYIYNFLIHAFLSFIAISLYNIFM